MFSTYHINKANFISQIQKARRQKFFSQKIKLALQAIELIFFNPFAIFQKLPGYKKPLSVDSNMTTSSLNNIFITSSFTLVGSWFSLTQIPPTLANAKKVKEMEEPFSRFRNQTLDFLKLTLSDKIL